MPTSCVCGGDGLRAGLRADLDRYAYAIKQRGASGPVVRLRVGLLSQGAWATTAYRLNHHFRYRRHPRPMIVISDVFHRVIMALTGIHIDPHAHVGPGLKFPHGGHIVIGPVRMGSNCDIFQGVTMGMSESTLGERPARPDVPSLGDRVWVGPGAVIAGSVTIDDDAVVGANSLLVRDVPARGVMIGVPARLVSRKGSFTQITYRNMREDIARKAAMGSDADTVAS